VTKMTIREIVVTLTIALVAAGSAFFGASWQSGYQEAFQTSGLTFFGTISALLVFLGIDPRRKPPPN
jgi:hypothetical protein